MAQLGRAATNNDVLIWEHGRRLGIVGDGQSGDPSVLMLDGNPIASNRLGAGLPFIIAIAAGSNGVGAITVTGAVGGDTVVAVENLSTPAVVARGTSFEATVSVAGQVQQLSVSNLSGNNYRFTVVPQS
jgi:hypothetical protein